ncbi:Gfo/Idh/MocA family protein [Plantactinospora sp. KBS50]|uniref:Gfo/Idh/MocA family protein n=1 Tax=Plantactinospora sp. KBS50 TaxID=2024580 RepID=UPI000BAAEC83|nr:Gfo/Idh/MocA family oxidoreductase [Plantactinospora sp. KBS50]ASW57604.1 oxidoreductase [Plantactinospora sp. KBS50]
MTGTGTGTGTPVPGGTPVRLGVLGCAEIAWRKTLPALAGVPQLRLTAVASRDPERAARFGERFGAQPVTGYPALLERDDVDAVYLPLPAALHAPWVDRALRAGKHVLAEKPLATVEADARRLVALADSRGLVLAENYMFTLHSQHAQVRELIGSGLIGEPRLLSAAFAIPALPREDIRYRPDVGGGALADVGGYPLRAATLLLGDRLEVVGATLRRDPARGVDLGGTALLVTPDGVAAQLAFGMEHAYRCEYEVWGSAGRLRLDRAFTPPADHKPVLRIERGGEVQERLLAPDDHFEAALRAFADAVRTGTDSGLQGAAVLRQAALVQRVRDVARYLDVPN